MPPVRTSWPISVSQPEGDGWRRVVLLVPSLKEGWAEQSPHLFCLVHQPLRGSDHPAGQPAVPDGQPALVQCRSSYGGCCRLLSW